MGTKIWRTVTLMAALFVGSPAWADNQIYAVPTGWRLQQYIGSALSAYFTGSICANGLIQFPASATSDEKNRFYALVLTAKATGKYVGVFYETTSGQCQITSFYAEG